VITALLSATFLVISATDPCATLQPGRTITARIVTTRHAPGDTMTATVCIVPQRDAAALRIGSYHGELHFDSTMVRVARVDRPEGGIRVENSTLGGQVNFAGAAPSGFPGRALVTVVLKLQGASAKPSLRLLIKELNTTDGQKLSQEVVVEGPPR
jgi:hypothetical protein